jgi:hypothetical protein
MMKCRKDKQVFLKARGASPHNPTRARTMEPYLLHQVINLQPQFSIISAHLLAADTSRGYKRGNMMNREATHLNVKNLCSRKLWELAASRAVDGDQLRAVARELQLRRHYLQELENLMVRRTHH